MAADDRLSTPPPNAPSGYTNRSTLSTVGRVGSRGRDPTTLGQDARSTESTTHPARALTETDKLSQAWGEWIAHQGPWQVFGALTYDQRRRPVDARGYHVMPAELTTRQHVRRWLQNVSSVTHGRLEAAVVALEYQKNGWPHFHPLIRLSGELQGREFEQLGQAWFRKHGYARLEEPRSQDDVAAYAAKYVLKDLARGDVLFWPLRGPWPDRQEQLL